MQLMDLSTRLNSFEIYLKILGQFWKPNKKKLHKNGYICKSCFKNKLMNLKN